MTVLFVPFTFRDGTSFNVEDVNRNLAQARDNLQKSADRRFTYSLIQIDLAGQSSTMTTSQNQYIIKTGSNRLQVMQAFVSLTTSTTGVFEFRLRETPSITVSGWTDLSLNTANSTNISHLQSAVLEPNETYDMTVIGPAGAWSITLGCLYLLCRHDRDFSPSWTPSLFTSSSPLDGDVLLGQLEDLAADVAADAAASTQARYENHTVFAFNSGTAQDLRRVLIPCVNKKFREMVLSVDADTGATVTASLTDAAGTVLASCTCTGTTNAVTVGTLVQISVDQTGDFPTSTVFVNYVLFSVTGGNVRRATCTITSE